MKNDKIIIRELKLKTTVGTFPEEKEHKQEIILTIEVFCDIRKAAKSDNLKDTVDYKALKKEIIQYVENGNFNLIERIAEDCANICLTHKGVKSVRIILDKPGCLTRAKSAAVEIIRP